MPLQAGLPAPRPIVVFDMAFKSASDYRAKVSVTNAGRFLSAALRQEGIATPYFLNRPLRESGARRIAFPDGMRAGERPLIFALSLYDILFAEAQEETEIIKDLYPGAKIMIGGPSVNATQNLMRLVPFFPHADAFVKGDGEGVIGGVVRALGRGWLEPIKGAYIRNDGFEYLNNDTAVLDRNEFNSMEGVKAYPALIEDLERVGRLELSTSRGCKYSCAFCVHEYHGRRIDWTAERIVEELWRIKGMVGRGILPPAALRIEFVDDDFFQRRRRALDFLELVAADPALRNSFSFSYTSSVGSLLRRGEVDVELLDAIARVRTRQIAIGTDGFHQSTLEALKGGTYTWDQARLVMKELHARRIGQTHFVILTHPGITRLELLETFRNMTKVLLGFGSTLRLTIGNIYASALEGSPLMDDALARNVPETIDNDAGDVKVLPLHCQLTDKTLNRWLLHALWQPFFNGKRDRRRLARLGRSMPVVKKFLRLRKKHLPDKATVYQALRNESDNSLIQAIAIAELLKSYRRFFGGRPS